MIKKIVNTLLKRHTAHAMGGKTLVCILNYNLKDQTDILYRLLKPYESTDYDVAIIDNGSPPDQRCDTTTYQLEENGYFGGGLNYAFTLMQKNPQYDSLLFLNNDLIVHGQAFVKTLRFWMETTGYKVLSPCIIQPEEGQLYWKQMQNWGKSTPRPVTWIDFQAPMIHRDVIEEIGQFSDDLYLGYGQDVYTGYICDKKGWTIAVCDMVPAIHYNSLTLKTGKAPISMSTYAERALANMEGYFKKIGQEKTLKSFRRFGKTYKV